MRPQAIFQATHDLTLIFEGMCVLDAKFDGEKSDHTANGSCSVASSVATLISD